MPFNVLCFIAAATAAAALHAEETFDLYPEVPPGAERYSGGERQYLSEQWQTEVVTNVSNPTLTPFLPARESANGTAIIIAPGGGFHALSINSEGNDVARWLNERGVAAFVLRYRLVPSTGDAVADMSSKPPAVVQKDMADMAPLAGADGLAAVALVRARAASFGIRPDRIGLMGFSAGGSVATYVTFNFSAQSRPDFVVPVYAAARWLQGKTLPENAPPAFIVAATDDQLGLAADSIKLYNAWLDAGISAELHMYAHGGHGFGMRRQNLPSDTWIERFGDWLGERGLLQRPE